MTHQTTLHTVPNPGLKPDLKAMLEFGIWWESRPRDESKLDQEPAPSNKQKPHVNGEAA